MNKNLRKAMISAICMLIVGVMSLTGVTYAWFTDSEEAIVSGMAFNVKSPAGGVLISDEAQSGWRYSIDLSDAEGKPLTFEGFAPTSTAPSTIKNGELQFFNATVDTTVAANKLGKVITTSGVGDGAYFKKTIYMYNEDLENSIKVNLEGTSFGITLDKKTQTAMRLALVKHGVYDKTAGATLTTAIADDVVIYEPYANTLLDGTTGEEKRAYRGITGASSTPFDSTASDCAYSEAVSTVVSLTDDKLTMEIPAGKCYAVTVYIWLEGQDPDCVNQIGGGKLSAELHFTKVS